MPRRFVPRMVMVGLVCLLAYQVGVWLSPWFR
jgi:hypothetical protein